LKYQYTIANADASPDLHARPARPPRRGSFGSVGGKPEGYGASKARRRVFDLEQAEPFMYGLWKGVLD